MNLHQGDGGLYASFNINLDLWVNSICLSVGAQECQGEENIEQLNFKDLTSGKWSYSGPIYCPTHEEAEYISNDRERLKNRFPQFKTTVVPFEQTASSILSTESSSFKITQVPLPRPGFNVIKENKLVDPEYLFETYIWSEEFQSEHAELFEQEDLNKQKILDYVLSVTNKKTWKNLPAGEYKKKV